MHGTSPSGDVDLLESARRVARNAYAPYSRFAVGCAIRCKGDGALFVGCNVENASYGLCICAERTAAAAAIAAGRRDIEVVAVYARGPELPVPCGACRQFLAELAPEARILVANDRSSRSFSLSELLPHPFGACHLPDPGLSS